MIAIFVIDLYLRYEILPTGFFITSLTTCKSNCAPILIVLTIIIAVIMARNMLPSTENKTKIPNWEKSYNLSINKFASLPPLPPIINFVKENLFVASPPNIYTIYPKLIKYTKYVFFLQNFINLRPLNNLLIFRKS